MSIINSSETSYYLQIALPNKISGALYHNVTTTDVKGRRRGFSTYLAKPKSPIFKTPSLFKRRLAPFIYFFRKINYYNLY